MVRSLRLGKHERATNKDETQTVVEPFEVYRLDTRSQFRWLYFLSGNRQYIQRKQIRLLRLLSLTRGIPSMKRIVIVPRPGHTLSDETEECLAYLRQAARIADLGA